MKKCPKCEVNWIKDDEELCAVCLKDMFPAKTQVHQIRPNVYFNELFIFKTGDYFYDGKHGFRAYNSQGEHVGIVFMTDDDRGPAYKHCELHCFPEYYSRYGEWHRITSHGNRISWEFLCNVLKTQKEYPCFID